MSTKSTNARVQKHRDALRLAGFRPVQIWVPDTRLPGFDAQCRQQSLLAAESDQADADTQRFMADALDDVAGWTP